MFRARPLQWLCGNKEGDVGPVNGWVRIFEVCTWWNGTVMKGHDRLHDARNTSSSLEVPNLRFD